MNDPNYGSLGEIKWEDGFAYTIEDEGYAVRYWFGQDKDKAVKFLKEFLKSYSYIMSEEYLEKLPEKTIEIVREEYTIKICSDPAQVKLNGTGRY